MTAESYWVPLLIEADPSYASLHRKIADLHALQQKLEDERHEVEREIAAQPVSNLHISASVAKLLSEEQDGARQLKTRLDEINNSEHDVEAAIEILRRRISDAKPAASALVVAQSRDEFRRRVVAVAKAASDLHGARMNCLDIKWQSEDQNVAWLTTLNPLSLGFLGDHIDGELVALSKVAGNV